MFFRKNGDLSVFTDKSKKLALHLSDAGRLSADYLPTVL
jgi:hypothetical protein